MQVHLRRRLPGIRNVIVFKHYIASQAGRRQAGVLIERDPDGDWQAWPVVASAGWDDAYEAETQCRTVSACRWLPQLWRLRG